jgi:hypothetical protein
MKGYQQCYEMCNGKLQIVKKVELEAQRKPGRGRKRNPIEDLRREVAIMRTLRHKNIVSLQEVVDDPSGNKMLLVMDYMEGGPVMTRDALERGRCIPEPLALQYFRDMCKVCFENKVFHLDGCDVIKEGLQEGQHLIAVFSRALANLFDNSHRASFITSFCAGAHGKKGRGDCTISVSMTFGRVIIGCATELLGVVISRQSSSLRALEWIVSPVESSCKIAGVSIIGGFRAF